MNDNQFELLLKNSLPELPPEDIASKVNPWRRFVFYIIIGLIFNTFKTGMALFSYILPVLGNIFLIQGFQPLRNENRYFKLGWLFSLFCFIVTPLLKINPVSYKVGESSPFILVFILVYAVAFYGMFRCIALGVTQIQEECGHRVNHRLKRMILTCSSALVFFNIITNKPTWSGYLILAVYVVLIVCIMLLMREIRDVGYSIRISPLILSKAASIILTCILFGIGFFIGEFFVTLEPTNETEWRVSDVEEVKDIKDDLEKMGVPCQVLDSMKEKDILLCQNAKQVHIQKNEWSSDNVSIPQNYSSYDIAIELSDKENHWKLIHYFEWSDDETFYSSDCIVLWPVERGMQDIWNIKSGYTGQILYNSEGKDYRASFDDLEITSIYMESIEAYTGDPEIIAEFTFPKKSTEKRGYISYDAVADTDRIVKINSWIKYIHQTNRFLYPNQTTVKYWKNRYWNEGKNEDNFVIIETSLHH